MDNVKTVIEALIFASEVPLAVDRIREILPDVETSEVHRILHELADEYRERKGGFYLHEVAGGFQFRTRTELSPWITLLRKTRPVALSRAAMETLAVIAYRQPVVKSEIDSIRGVDTGGALKGLLDKKLVRMMGRKDVPGRPIVYGTTKRFLEVFNLKELTELPTLRELKDLQEEPQDQRTES
ncbi:MAG: SMC-Scp complex subunit ScpB [Deltaproteobacteria bacterium]|nr:SMC-Scp complex subunit ScpB [Deltaproteobacteria bacterium]